MKSWDRLQQVVEWSGLSINAFAISIGLKRAENLYQIKKGKHGISIDLTNKITDKYPDISASWLLVGEGDMLHRPLVKRNIIPLYLSDFRDIKNGLKVEDAAYYIEVPSLSDSDFAAVCMGNSMEPDIPAGAFVVLKQIEPTAFLPGEIYFVVTESYSTLRKIRSVEGNEKKVRLIPSNLQDYDEMLIDMNMILQLFIVKGVISTRVV